MTTRTPRLMLFWTEYGIKRNRILYFCENTLLHHHINCWSSILQWAWSQKYPICCLIRHLLGIWNYPWITIELKSTLFNLHVWKFKTPPSISIPLYGIQSTNHSILKSFWTQKRTLTLHCQFKESLLFPAITWLMPFYLLSIQHDYLWRSCGRSPHHLWWHHRHLV